MRPYLLWISTGAAGPVSNVFGETRQYDVLYHNYAPSSAARLREAEFYIPEPGEKLNIAAKYLSNVSEGYRAVAILDDDLSFDTDALNRAFLVGDVLDLGLWQPSLTLNSFGSHKQLFQATNGERCYGTKGVRQVPFVEIMMPFFSRDVLREALPTFDINESGWGLDVHMWPKLSACYVLDGISFGHYRIPQRRNRVLRNGLTCWQELWIQQQIHEPETAPVFPPGYKRPIE